MVFKKAIKFYGSKSRELKAEHYNSELLGGVYHTTNTERPRTSLSKEDSSGSLATIDTASSDASQDQAWISSGLPNHHADAPLLVRSAVSKRHLGDLLLSDEEVLSRVLVTRRKLPRARDTYFASNHVMINNERTRRTIVPLKRNRAMDEIANGHAHKMAEQQSLFHTDAMVLSSKFTATRFGANVGRGVNLDEIHYLMMTWSESNKNNIIDRRFVSMGVGTAKCTDGTFYLCQIFSD